MPAGEARVGDGHGERAARCRAAGRRDPGHGRCDVLLVLRGLVGRLTRRHGYRRSGDGARPCALLEGQSAAVVRLDDAAQLAADVGAAHDVAALRAEVRQGEGGAVVEAAHELVVERRSAVPAARRAGDRLTDRERAVHDRSARVARRADRVRLREVALDGARPHARIDPRGRSVAREVPVAHDPGELRGGRNPGSLADPDHQRPAAVPEAGVLVGHARADHDRRVNALCRPTPLTGSIGRQRHLHPAQVRGVGDVVDSAPAADHGADARRRCPPVIVEEGDRPRARRVERGGARERHDGCVVREGRRVVPGIDRDRRDVQSVIGVVGEQRRAREDVEIRGSDRLPRCRRGVVEHAVRRRDDALRLTARVVADRASAELTGRGRRTVVANQRDLVVQRTGGRQMSARPADLLAADNGPRRRAAHRGHGKRSHQCEHASKIHHG